MRILFIQDNGINESLALTELSAYLKTLGHQTDLVLTREESQLRQTLQSVGFDLVIVPCPIYGHKTALAIARMVKQVKPKVPVLFGGTHPTFAPGIVQYEEVDFVVVGEAEKAVGKFAQKLAEQKTVCDLPGIYNAASYRNRCLTTPHHNCQSNGCIPAQKVEDLDSLPMPDRKLYYRYPFIRDFPWKKFMTGRGCVNSCAFCYNSYIRSLYRGTGYVRRKSPERVIKEILDVRACSRLTWVHFSDDLFVTDSDWIERFGTEYRKYINLPFSCNASADRIDPDIAAVLAKAGCKVVAVGVETANEQRRMKLLRKPITNSMLFEAARAIKGAGIKLTTFNMIALPGETLEEAVETVQFSAKLGADFARITMALPLPGTTMAVEAVKQGFLDSRLGQDPDAAINLVSSPIGPYFKTPDACGFRSLLYAAPLVARASHSPVKIASWLRNMPSRLFSPFHVWVPLQEKRMYAIPWLDGLRFYSHVGNPWLRTANFVSLI